MMVGHNRYGGYGRDTPPPIWHHYRQWMITTILCCITLLSLLNGEFENCCQNVKTTECDDTNWTNSTECKGLPSGFPTILKPPRLLVLLITTFHIVKHYLLGPTIDFDSETWRTMVLLKIEQVLQQTKVAWHSPVQEKWQRNVWWKSGSKLLMDFLRGDQQVKTAALFGSFRLTATTFISASQSSSLSNGF